MNTRIYNFFYSTMETQEFLIQAAEGDRFKVSCVPWSSNFVRVYYAKYEIDPFEVLKQSPDSFFPARRSRFNDVCKGTVNVLKCA